MNEQYGLCESFSNWYSQFKESLLGMNIGADAEVENSGEEVVLRVLSKQIKPDQKTVVFDIGANKGDYIRAVRRAFPAAEIHAFEPQETCIEHLRMLQGDKVYINECGVGDTIEERTLYSDADASGLASLYLRQLDHIGVRMLEVGKVHITTIDDYCANKNIQSIFLMKLDIEGNELFALRGAEKVLSEKRVDNIQTEFGGCNIDSRTFFRDFWNMLSPNYKCFRVMRDGLHEINSYTERLEIFSMQNFLFQKR